MLKIEIKIIFFLYSLNNKSCNNFEKNKKIEKIKIVKKKQINTIKKQFKKQFKK